MRIFCILWLPLCFLFRRAARQEDARGSIRAFLLGYAIAAFRFLTGGLLPAGEFGLSRWLSAAVDGMAIPVLVPILVYAVCRLCGFFRGVDFSSFVTLAVCPIAAAQGFFWNDANDMLALVITPFLWSAVAAGIPFIVDLTVPSRRLLLIIPAGILSLALPFAAATCWWAFFCREIPLALGLLAAAGLPFIVSIVTAVVSSRSKN
ncbi:MAG: hypothetical protein LBR16_00090 [Treponema sp.]|nr:hypothetical protein [Treponema sp.]